MLLILGRLLLILRGLLFNSGGLLLVAGSLLLSLGELLLIPRGLLLIPRRLLLSPADSRLIFLACCYFLELLLTWKLVVNLWRLNGSFLEGAAWGECLPGARPARYFSINYPDFSPRFTLPWRSPPSRPHCTAHLPYKARCKIKQDL